MGLRGVALALLLLVALLPVPRPAAAVAPIIQNISWYPEVPARGENVTVYADLSSPNGVVASYVSWCIIPTGTCIIYEMQDADRDGRWNTTRGIRVASPPYTGADFNISAQDAAADPAGNVTYSSFYYVQFGDAISVDASLNPTSAAPGDSVSLAGIAKYAYDDGTGLKTNDSTPAKNSNVTIRVVETGATSYSKTDGSGRISASLTAPAAEGGYTIRVTVSNRSLTGYVERNLVVAIVPAPDLAFVPGTFAVTPSPARAGDPVTISFSVENRGNALAAGFTVRVSVIGSSAELFRRDFTGVTLASGENRGFSAQWTAVVGPVTVNVTINPGGAVPELSLANNYAARALTVEQGLSIILIAGITILLVGVAVAAALVYRRRRGQPKGPQ